MRKTTIGVDMDGVLADWAGRACEVFNNEFELDLVRDDFITYNSIPVIQDRLKEKCDLNLTTKHIRDKLSAVGFFRHISPFLFVREGMEKLSSFADVLIVTKPIDWNYCPDEKASWLEEYLPNLNYETIMVSGPEAKKHIDIDFMIDDDPKVIESVRERDITPIVIEHKWNEEYRKQNPEIASFKSFYLAAEYLEKELGEL